MPRKGPICAPYSASEVGNLHAAMNTIDRMMSIREKQPTIHGMVEVLFSTDGSGRTALYYACLNGHVDLVQFYLGLYIVSRATMSMNIKKMKRPTLRKGRCTLETWFSVLDNVPYSKFRKTEFDLCVQNSFSDDIKNILTKENFSIEDIMNNVTRTSNLYVLHRNPTLIKKHLKELARTLCVGPYQEKCNAQMKKKGKSKPTLCFEDDEDNYEDVKSDLEEMDGKSYGEEEEGRDSKIEAGDTKKAGYGLARNAADIPTEESVCDLEIIDLSDDGSLNRRSIDSFGFVSLDLSDDESMHQDSTAHNEDEWDVVSDVQSVKSFNSLASIGVLDTKMTFKEAMLKTPLPNSSKNSFDKSVRNKVEKNVSRGKHAVERLTTLKEDEGIEVDDDLFFDRDGAKGMRGGRQQDLFKGNAKTFRQRHKNPRVNERKRGKRKT